MRTRTDLEGEKARQHDPVTSLYRTLIACLLAFACGAAPARASALVQVMRLLSAVKASTVRSTETKRVEALTEPLTLSGRLSYCQALK